MAASGEVDQDEVYWAYGKVMHKFQLLELTLWMLLVPEEVSWQKGMAKIDKWDQTTFGSLARSIRSQGLLDDPT